MVVEGATDEDCAGGGKLAACGAKVPSSAGIVLGWLDGGCAMAAVWEVMRSGCRQSRGGGGRERGQWMPTFTR